MDRQTDRYIDKQAGRKADRKTGNQRVRQAGGQQLEFLEIFEKPSNIKFRGWPSFSMRMNRTKLIVALRNFGSASNET
jgi:hypothetical protein